MQDRLSWEEADHCLSSLLYSLVLQCQRSWSQKCRWSSIFLWAVLFTSHLDFEETPYWRTATGHYTTQRRYREYSSPSWTTVVPWCTTWHSRLINCWRSSCTPRRDFWKCQERTMTSQFLISCPKGTFTGGDCQWRFFETVVAVNITALLICRYKCASVISKAFIVEETLTTLAYLIFCASFCFAVVALSSQYEKQVQELWICCKNNLRNLLVLATAVCMWTCYMIWGENPN